MSGKRADGRNGVVPWNHLERRRGSAFLVAGALLLGFVAANALVAFTDVEPPRWLVSLFVTPALVASYLGLLGFYPAVVERAPWSARAGGLVAAVATVAAVGLLVVALLAGSLSASEALYGLFYVVSLAATVLGFVLFGSAVLRTGHPSRAVGLALLGPPAVYVSMVVTGAMAGGEPPTWSTFVVSAVQAGAHLAVGVVVRGGPSGPDGAGRAVDSPAN